MYVTSKRLYNLSRSQLLHLQNGVTETFLIRPIRKTLITSKENEQRDQETYRTKYKRLKTMKNVQPHQQ